jgi:hypothetical protein
VRWLRAKAPVIGQPSVSLYLAQVRPCGSTKIERANHTMTMTFKQRIRAEVLERIDAIIRPAKVPDSRRRPAYLLPRNHEAVTECRTKFPSTVQEVSDDIPVLKSGVNNEKIGGKITKGDWPGPVYTLTLEERATCPNTCHHWLSCYGNNMNWPVRWRHGPKLEQKLRIEVALLAEKHPDGLAVRLHVLGDFYSPEYVDLWRQLLERHPALHIFGFTARWHVETDPIAAALVALARQSLALERQGRFRMRFSDAPASLGVPATISVQTSAEALALGATVCPEQEGKTESCSTCAVCWHWQSKKPIGFLQH